MIIRDKIKIIRKSLGLTQAEFAQPLGVSGGQISAIELGRSKPSDTLTNFLRRHYNINDTWWDTGEGEMFQRPPDVTNLQYVLPPQPGETAEDNEKIVNDALRRIYGWDVAEAISTLTALPRSARMKILAQMFEAIEKEDEKKREEEEE